MQLLLLVAVARIRQMSPRLNIHGAFRKWQASQPSSVAIEDASPVFKPVCAFVGVFAAGVGALTGVARPSFRLSILATYGF